MSGGRGRSRALAVWLLLLAVVVAIVGVELSGSLGPDARRDESAQVVRETKFLLPVPVEGLGVVGIALGEATYRFERDEAGAWFYHYHPAGASVDPAHDHRAEPAQAELIERAFGAFGRTRIGQEIGRGAAGEDYGVTRPAMVVAIYQPDADRPLARYMIGDLLPDQFNRYVTEDDAFSIFTIPNYQFDNLLQLIEAVSGG